MVRSKYEVLLARPHVEGTNKLSITHDSIKKHRSVYPSEKHKWERLDRTSFKLFFVECKMKLALQITCVPSVLQNLNITDIKFITSVFSLSFKKGYVRKDNS